MSRGPLALLALLVAFGCSPEKQHDLRNANVLLITLDTTRADRIGAYGYAKASTPNLDRLASEGVLFEECITATGYTLPSHSSIMTGLYPPAHGVRLNGEAALADDQVTLAETLSARGYRTAGFAGAFVLDGRWGIGQGFQHYDDDFQMGDDQKLDLARVQRPANQVVDAALQWLGQDSTKPFFAWVHLYDAHVPYEPPEPFRSRAASPYDGEISFADAQVARLLQWIEQRGLREQTIVIVTADHGEGLGDHGEEEHGYYVYDYAVHVPLIARIPGRTRARVAEQVRTVDIAPTVLELVGGGQAPSPVRPSDARRTGEAPVLHRVMDGESLLPLLDGKQQPVRYAYSESVATKLQYGWAGLYSLRTNTHKFIEAPRSELYELTSDPAEAKNRLDDLRRVAVDLKTRLARLREDAMKRAPKTQEANLDSETLAKLASLGYLSGGRAAETLDERGLADPKDKMHLFDSIGYAANLMSKDVLEEAVEVLELVLHDDPNIPQAQLLAVSAYRKSGRVEKAKQILDANLKKDPGNVHALIAMGEILSQEGRGDDVIAIAKTALAKDAKNARAYELIADAYMQKNDPKGALPNLRKAVEIQPKLSRSRNNLSAALIGTGQLAEAEKELQDILRGHPKFPLANFHLGLLREQQNRLPEAKAAYEAELRNQPKSVVARFNLGNLMLRMGDTAGAETQMRTLIKDDPGSARPYLMLARVLLGRGELREVESLANAGLQRATQPDLKALGYFLLADVYSREGRRAELQEAVRKGNYYRAQIRS